MDVLVVDDNELNVRALSRALKAHHTVRVALTPAEALAQIEARPPDVIICDFELGSESCTELLRTITEQHPRTRRILYSASQPELWQELVRDRLVDETLSKPVTTETLLASIDGADVED